MLCSVVVSIIIFIRDNQTDKAGREGRQKQVTLPKREGVTHGINNSFIPWCHYRNFQSLGKKSSGYKETTDGTIQIHSWTRQALLLL